MRANGVDEKYITGDGDEYKSLSNGLKRSKIPMVIHYMNGLI